MDGRQKDNTMLVFLDTEFTKFAHPDLISLALVALSLPTSPPFLEAIQPSRHPGLELL